jgi:hypothetical protein
LLDVRRVLSIWRRQQRSHYRSCRLAFAHFYCDAEWAPRHRGAERPRRFKRKTPQKATGFSRSAMARRPFRRSVLPQPSRAVRVLTLSREPRSVPVGVFLPQHGPYTLHMSPQHLRLCGRGTVERAGIGIGRSLSSKTCRA